MSRYIIDISRNTKNSGDIKPKSDIIKILNRNFNFRNINIKQFKIDKINKHLFVKLRIKHTLNTLNLNDKDIVLINYPMYSGIKFLEYLKSFLINKNVETIVVIHDLDSIRFNSAVVGESLNDEINYLNGFDFIISHNKNMTNLLKENGLKSKIVNLNIFDYLSNENSNFNNYKYKNNITFAGNLNKAPFLKEFSVKLPIHFDLYGNIDNDSNINKSLDYHGSVSPEVLAKKMGHGFGLVWDGNSINNVDGDIGKYLKYNNPYKISSYISAGMPVIVWNHSAIKDFVIENNIGIAIDSLNNIPKYIDSISDNDFNEMVINVNNIKKKINSGYFTTNAINEILNLKV